MNVIRPELAAGLRRYREPLAGGLLAAVGVWLAWRHAPAPLALLAAAALVALGAGIALAALRRLRFTARTPAAGIVTLDEARLGYFAPAGGGFIDLASLTQVDVMNAAWRLTAEDGTRLTIPTGAREADLLYDALARLPGLDYPAALAAIDAASDTSVTVWRRAPDRPYDRLH